MSTRILGRSIFLVAFAALGCSPKSDKAEPSAAPPKVELKPDDAGDGSKPGPTRPGTVAFRDAVLFEPPDGEARPPDLTAAGKNVAKLFEAVAGTPGTPGLWEQVQFATAEGKRIDYFATLKTDLGDMEVELFGADAPNHVRSFVALARAGFFNGLPFHRIVREDGKEQPFHYIEAGCPRGTGEVGYGSIGYWLKPEISSRWKHEEGTIGAWHAEELESAACRFYVTLSRAPWMDGGYTIFGKITKGLDVARTINKQPVHDDAFKDRPREPVVIREVTVHTRIE